MFDDRMKKLARNLDRVADKDSLRIRREKEIEELRKDGAAELYRICAAFINTLNSMVREMRLELAPPAFDRENFQEGRETIFQVNATGRVLQFSFFGTGPLIVTDELKIPYTMEGLVHWYNQDMLEREDVQEHRLFYSLGKGRGEWRFYDPATYRSGVVNSDYLADRLEELL